VPSPSLSVCFFGTETIFQPLEETIFQPLETIFQPLEETIFQPLEAEDLGLGLRSVADTFILSTGFGRLAPPRLNQVLSQVLARPGMYPLTGRGRRGKRAGSVRTVEDPRKGVTG
jgi:hypothetical protein